MENNYRNVNIHWDTDGIDPESLSLPKTANVPNSMSIEDIADWLSNEYGYCVESIEV